MNALKLLKADHDHFKEILARIKQSTQVADKRALVNKLYSELELHNEAEETLFYPLFANRPGFDELISSSYEDHQHSEDLFAEILGATDYTHIEKDLADWLDTFQEHIEREEAELFSKVRQELNEDQLQRLGKKIEEFKETGGISGKVA